ncbi:hypothetical protein ACHAXT_010157 [Thalassiosira profunda]
MSSLQIGGTSGRQEIVFDLLGKARACAVDGSRGSFANALRSLHSALVALRSPGATLVGGEELGDTSQPQQPESDDAPDLPRSGETGQEFRQSVADKLINLERVVVSIDEEINGDEDVDALDYEADFDWYNDAVEMIDRGAGGHSVSSEGIDLLESTDDRYPECSDPERWIDRCLDACGYANSLEAAADCLRRIAREPSAPSATTLLPFASNDAAEPEQSDSEDSLEDSRPAAKRGGFLAHLFAVASVWCEDVFVTRTDPLQQQYVTEFLLEPLESRQLTQTDLQAGIAGDGSQLATTLVQGVTLRLDVSRTESVRMDGMRVAEAMASLLGQQLRFDELHPPGDGDASNEKEDTENTKKEQTAKSKKKTGKKRRERLKPRVPVVLDPDAEYFTDDSDSSDDSSQSDSPTDASDESSDSNSSWGEDSLEPYGMDDDEEDLRRVPRPHTLRDCLAYFVTAENDDLAYDKHEAALAELATIVASEPLDLLDVVSTLVRILLFLEDKFSLPQFLEKRWGCLVAFGVHAPVETCLVLVQAMRGNISLGTRLDALAVLSSVAQELSGMAGQHERALPNSSSQEVTRRWRRSRTPQTTSANRFGPVAMQMIYSLFGLLSDTRSDETIWGDAIGEKFLSEFLRTLSTMLHCARNYPSSSLPVIAGDLFDLAWSFHDAKCPDVRYAALMAFATCVSIDPALVLRISGLGPYLKRCSEQDENADCRSLAALVEGSISEALSQS